MEAGGAGPLAGSRLSYLFLLVSDFDRMLSFYRDTLGLSMYYLEQGECAFLRTAPDRGPAIALYSGRQGQPVEAAHWFVVFDVTGIEVVVERLKQRGVEVGEIEEGPNERYAKFSDPEGNVLEVHERKGG